MPPGPRGRRGRVRRAEQVLLLHLRRAGRPAVLDVARGLAGGVSELRGHAPFPHVDRRVERGGRGRLAGGGVGRVGGVGGRGDAVGGVAGVERHGFRERRRIRRLERS